MSRQSSPDTGAPPAKWFVSTLRRWYRAHGRELPWREIGDPYRIWLSEIMLQQTQVSRVIGYYERFLRRFPTVESLAAASWRSVLPVWRGLGYYHRAHNLAAAARIIVEQHKGAMPSDDEALLALPGIGRYTAAAIQSFAFNKPRLALDTNITRVLTRFFGKRAGGAEAAAEEVLRAGRRSSAELNHAIMDIGALICTARFPDCDACPLAARCASAHRVVTVSRARSTASGRGVQDVVAACIFRDRKLLLAKRAASRGGAWEFPGGKREPGESLRAALKREIKEELGVEVAVRPPFHVEETSHLDKRYRIHFSRCQILRGKLSPTEHEELAWGCAADLLEYDLAPSNRDALRLLAGEP